MSCKGQNFNNNIFNQCQKLFSRIFLIKFCNVCNAMFIIANIDAIKNSTSPLSSLSKQEAAPCPHLGSQEEEKHWKRVAFSSPPTEPGNIVFINFMFLLFSLFFFICVLFTTTNRTWQYLFQALGILILSCCANKAFCFSSRILRFRVLSDF